MIYWSLGRLLPTFLRFLLDCSFAVSGVVERVDFANLSLFMNNLSYLIYKKTHLNRYSINDIKSLFMAERYTTEALKFYGKNTDDILISNAIEYIAQFSMIHGDTG